MKEIISATPPATGLIPQVAGLDENGSDVALDGDLEADGSAVERRALAVGVVHHGERLDKWLAVAVPEFSRAYFQQLLESGGVALNGLPARKASVRLKAGDSVLVELRATVQAHAFLPEPMALHVVHEDEHLLVIDKPAGLVVHPAAGHWGGTLLNGLLAYHDQAARLPRAGIVHRLDKDTSGLMLVGKTPQAVDALVRQIAARQVHRIYLALAHGPWRHGSEVWVDQPIGRDARNRLRMAVHAVAGASAKVAQTRIRLLDEQAGGVLVACKLHTGRTHQIRVHMGWLGCPLVADALYGGRALHGMSRQSLHAHRLYLRHPVTQEPLALQSALPQDLSDALVSAGVHYNGSQLDDWPAISAVEDPSSDDPVQASAT